MRVKVCVGARCTMMGSSAMLDALEGIQNHFFEEGEMEIIHVNCLNVCKEKGLEHTPVVEIDGERITAAKPQEISEMILERAGKLSK
ncbi:MAG: (2Fe-2S) ferredoxin domain-containing protein [Peptoniphilus sp.]|nr:(2Fe-2S) ferredoxin domain-containing protein [Peptoniphilus sp.]MDY3117925.1 (2Fe-2S) ferredoxin domain-containing protein [Peptoniphilus sp.]